MLHMYASQIICPSIAVQTQMCKRVANVQSNSSKQRAAWANIAAASLWLLAEVEATASRSEHTSAYMYESPSISSAGCSTNGVTGNLTISYQSNQVFEQYME